MLYDVSPDKPIADSEVRTGLATLALVAAYIPARRTLAIDHIVGLRVE